MSAKWKTKYLYKKYLKFNRRTYTEVTRFAGELIDGLNIFIKGNVNFQYNLKKKIFTDQLMFQGLFFLSWYHLILTKQIWLEIAPDKLDKLDYLHWVYLIVMYDIDLFNFAYFTNGFYMALKTKDIYFSQDK